MHCYRIKDDKTRLIKADDDTLNFVAKGLLEAHGLPSECLPNIIHGLQMTEIFYKRCKNPNIELLEHLCHTKQHATHYAALPVYILRHKTLNIASKPSSDIELLLNEFSTIINN